MVELDAIEQLIAVAAWPAALIRSLAQWRAHRAPELGDLVEAIGARIPIGAPLGFFAWRDQAWIYDPVAAGTLIARIEERGDDTGYTQITNLHVEHQRIDELHYRTRYDLVLGRVLYLCRWPADPRVGEVIVRWLEGIHVAWPRGWYGALGDREPLQRLFAIVSTTLREVVDARLVPRLRRLVDQPSGRSTASRAAQQELGAAALAAIDRLPITAQAVRTRAAELAGRVGTPPRRPGPPPPRRYDPDELWQQIALAPDDDGPRHVLADALLARDDPRGLVFAHQLGRVRGGVRDLVRKHWHTWMGEELSRILMRRSCVLARGMLETIRVGPGSTPPWLYDHAAGHRELLAVRVVRALVVAPDAYARFVAALPNVHTLAVDSSDIAMALAEVDVTRIVTVELASRRGEPLGDVLAPLARSLSQLATVALERAPVVEQVAAILAIFPRLATIAIANPPPDAAARAALAAVPQVRFGNQRV